MFIYKIWKENCDDFYIGSTKDFHKRKIKHKHTCNNPKAPEYNYKIYQHIRANGGWGSWTMDIIEECETRDREIELIKEMKPSLNSTHYNFDKKKWTEENADRLKEWVKKYREKNADKIKKKHSCECGGIYLWSNKARHIKSKKHQKFIHLHLHSPTKETSLA